MIRDAQPIDRAAIAAIYAPIVVETAISFEEEPPTPDEIAARARSSHFWLVAQENDEVAGYAYASRFHPRSAYRWSAEVSVYVAEVARSRGIGRVLLKTLMSRLVEAGFVNAFAGITIPNPPSESLFRSLRFEKVAHWRDAGFKLERWHDVGWWQLQLRDPPIPPSEPIVPPGREPQIRSAP